MSPTEPSLDSMLQRLKTLRSKLLPLHKALLNSERVIYEQSHGRIATTGEFFRLVIEHEWFSWLRPMSQLIVQIDELMSSKEPVTSNQAKALLVGVENLLKPAAEGTTPQQRYYQAIQRDPDIAFMHAEISSLLVQGH